MTLTRLRFEIAAESWEQIEARLAALDDPEPLAVTRTKQRGAGLLVEVLIARPLSAVEQLAVADGLPLLGPPAQDPVPDENWVARVQEMLHPVAAGRFLVHGPHDREKAAGHPFAIEIEAGEAFGTAHHASTQGCLIALSEGLDRWQPSRVLDLGTGSGVLAIATALVLRKPGILASDIDARSVEIARENAQKNGAGAWIEAIEAEGLDHPRLATPRSFDLIMANILAEPLIALAPAMVRGLKADGWLVLSGLLAEQADAVAAAYTAEGCIIEQRLPIEGWTTLVAALRE